MKARKKRRQRLRRLLLMYERVRLRIAVELSCISVSCVLSRGPLGGVAVAQAPSDPHRQEAGTIMPKNKGSSPVPRSVQFSAFSPGSGPNRIYQSSFPSAAGRSGRSGLGRRAGKFSHIALEPTPFL